MVLNKDLFGNFIADDTRETPVSIKPREHVVVWHGSGLDTPPHTMNHPNWDPAYPVTPFSSNQSNEVIHAGTMEAAKGRQRSVFHMYQVPKKLLDVVYRDSDNPSWSNTVGPPDQGLWEHTDKPIEDVEKSGMVTPYLNQYEDKGSVSYMIPKHLIKSGQVKYLGIDKQ